MWVKITRRNHTQMLFSRILKFNEMLFILENIISIAGVSSWQIRSTAFG